MDFKLTREQALIQKIFWDRDITETEEETEGEDSEDTNTTNTNSVNSTTNSTVSNTTNTVNSTNTASENTISKSSIKIEVLNGSGESKNLQKVVDELKGAGYKVTRTGSTNTTTKTTIINKKDVKDIILSNMKDVLGTGTISNSQSSSSKVDVTIIIGKDYK